MREGGREGGTCLCGGNDVRLVLGVEGTNGKTLDGQVPAEGGREGGIQMNARSGEHTYFPSFFLSSPPSSPPSPLPPYVMNRSAR